MQGQVVTCLRVLCFWLTVEFIAEGLAPPELPPMPPPWPPPPPPIMLLIIPAMPPPAGRSQPSCCYGQVQGGLRL